MHKSPLLVSCLIGFLGSCATSTGAGPEMTSTEFANDDGIFLYWGGVDRMLVHEKDQNLRSALHLLEDRLLEIPAEVGEEDVPEDAIRMAMRAVRGPLQFRVGYRQSGGQGLPVYGQLALPEESDASAHELADVFSRLIAGMVPQGGADANGLSTIPLGPMAAYHGALDSSFVVGMGDAGNQPVELGSLGLPAGVEPAVVVKMDFDQYFQGLQTALSMAGEDAAEGMQFMDMFNMEGVILTTAVGVDADRSYSVTTMSNYEDLLESTSGRPAGSLTKTALEMVPEDAVWASLGTANWAGTVDMVIEMIEEMAAASGEDPFGGQDPLDMVAAFTGIHLQRDLFEHIGHEWGMYMADSTGGGGLASLVFFASLDNSGGMEATLDRIEGMLSEMASASAKGYVSFRHWNHGDHEYRSLAFPGLPVPIEYTYAIVNDYFIDGFTPQAVIAGVEHFSGGGRSLLDNSRFREMTRGDDLEGLFAISFVDVPALLSDGYGWSQLLCAALTNGTRSPRDPERDAGLILPVYEDLAEGAKATVTTSRIIDGDLVAFSQGDASTLVNGTALLGMLDRLPALMALPALVGLGVAKQAEQEAKARAMIERDHAESKVEALRALGYVGDGDHDSDDDAEGEDHEHGGDDGDDHEHEEDDDQEPVKIVD